MNPLFFSAAAALLFSSAAIYVYSSRTASGPDAWRKTFILYGVISLLASAAVRYFQAEYPDALGAGAVLKFCASLPSVLFALRGYLQRKTKFGFLIVSAIVLGMIADININLNFFIGGAFFLAGHLLYDIAFVNEKKPSRKQIILWLAFTALMAVPLYIFRSRLGSFLNAAGALLYISMLISTVVFSWSLEKMVFAAALIFAFSDCFMILNILTNGTMFMKILALAVYYGSLLLYGAALSRRSTSI